MPRALDGNSILLVIGGGIAAYKALDLIRRAREHGLRVRCVLTPAGREFVTPLSIASLSGEALHEDLFSLTAETEMGHIQLSRAADLVVVAPATADLIAKMANGLANDLASTSLLATDKRILIAPAMNVRMWLHPAVQRNVETLRQDGVLIVGPDEGTMACGEFGPGRMAEPITILDAIANALTSTLSAPVASSFGTMQGRRIVVTSGPTHEPIDPVRYIANRSSGKQGHALAEAFAAAGASVRLISGPVSIPDPPGVETIHVETAREMLCAVEGALPADVFVAAAAVADWRVAREEPQKLKKGQDGAPVLSLIENPDILRAIASRHAGRPRLVVGFAAETMDVVENAKQKLIRKGCDLIVANDVSASSGVLGGVMGSERNRVHIISSSGVETWPEMSKTDVARKLAEIVGRRLEVTEDRQNSKDLA